MSDTLQRYNVTGELILEEEFTPSTESVNRQTLTKVAEASLVVNANYLALTSPTNAQNAAQIQRLTRECSALIRLLVGRLDDTAGT